MKHVSSSVKNTGKDFSIIIILNRPVAFCLQISSLRHFRHFIKWVACHPRKKRQIGKTNQEAADQLGLSQRPQEKIKHPGRDDDEEGLRQH